MSFLARHPRHSGRLLLELVPVPYSGSPDDARVVVLLLNPGGDPESAARELANAEYVEQNRLALSHESRYPVFWLDPGLSGTPGHDWWKRRLGPLVRDCGLLRVAERVMVFQWFPYHSTDFSRLPESLPSQAYSFRLLEGLIARGSRS